MGYVSFDISCNLIPICCGKFVMKDFEIISYQLRANFYIMHFSVPILMLTG